MRHRCAHRILLGILALLSAACASRPSRGPSSTLTSFRGPAPVQALEGKCDIESQTPADFEAGCEGGNEPDCACLVDLYQLSLSAPKMAVFEFSPKAIQLINQWWARTREEYVDACHKGQGEACSNAFGMWLAKEFKSYSEPKAFEYMVKGCELNHAESCNFLGSAWRDGYPGVPNKDAWESYRAFKKACDLGHRDSCSQMRQ